MRGVVVAPSAGACMHHHATPRLPQPPTVRRCNGGVNFMLAVDPQGVYRFAALQSEAGRRLLQRSGRSPDDISSIILVEPQGSYVKSAAILRIASRLRLPLPLLAAGLDLFPKDFKDAVYDQVKAGRGPAAVG